MRKKDFNVRGTIFRYTYENGKLVDRSILKDSVLDYDYWKTWRDVDNEYSRTYLKSNFDYKHNKYLMSYYATERDGKKVVYRRDFGSKTYLK